MVSPVTPFTEFHPSFKPLTHTTPFTFTGYAFLEMYEELVQYLTNTLSGEVNENLDLIYVQTQVAVNGLAADITTTKTQWQALFDAFMLDLIDELQGLNDAAMAGLVKNPSSLTSVELEKLYASKTVVATLNALVTTGRLSDTELAKKYASKVTQETVETGRLAQVELEKVFSDWDSVNRGFTSKFVPEGGAPAHGIITLKRGMMKPGTLRRIVAGNSNSVSPPKETMVSFYKKTHASVIINGSGWWTGDNDRLMGLSIKNGVLIQGWDPQPNDLGQEAAVIMRDGSLRMYSNVTAPSKIITDGGYNSFGWGSAVYKDGLVTDFLKWSRYALLSARQLIGDTVEGDFIIITIPGITGVSGATGADILNITTGMNIKNLYVLDGGGSCQTMIDGEYWLPSSDNEARPIPDALYFTAPKVGATPAVWHEITSRTADFEGGALEWSLSNGMVHVRIANMTAKTVGALLNIATLPTDVPRPPFNWTGLGYLNTEPNSSQNARVSSTGTIDISVSKAGAVFCILSYPIS